MEVGLGGKQELAVFVGGLLLQVLPVLALWPSSQRSAVASPPNAGDSYCPLSSLARLSCVLSNAAKTGAPCVSPLEEQFAPAALTLGVTVVAVWLWLIALAAQLHPPILLWGCPVEVTQLRAIGCSRDTLCR